MKKVQIWMVYGFYGSGKTLLLTALGLHLGKYYKNVVSNFKFTNLTNSKFLHQFTVHNFKNIEKDSLMLFSEAYKTLDCRESGKRENIDFTHEIQQIRKKHIDLVYDAERPQLMELRLRRITNYFIKSHGNFLEILKSSKSIWASRKQEAIIKVFHIINKKSFWDKYSREDLEHLFLYENRFYDYVNDIDVSTGNFFVIDGRKYYDQYNSEEELNKSPLQAFY